eukprot:661910-Rhodomonas_salina.1
MSSAHRVFRGTRHARQPSGGRAHEAGWPGPEAPYLPSLFSCPSVGIDFTGKCDRTPSTIWAHCLLQHALDTQGAEMQNKLSEVIFRAYFTDGLYPDVDNLVQLAAGLSFLRLTTVRFFSCFS